MGRMSTFLKIKWNKMLNKVEDPNEILDYAYQKQLEAMQNVKRGIAEIVTSKKRLEMQLAKLKEQIDKLQAQAQEAVKQDREDLARLAIERKLLLNYEITTLSAQIDELSQTQDQLITKEQNLRHRIEAFRTKKEIIKAQYSAAAAQVQISGVVSGIGSENDNIVLALERAHDKTEQMKARAVATTELEESGVFNDVFTIGSGKDDIDIELAKNNSNNLIESELKTLKSEFSETKALNKGEVNQEVNVNKIIKNSKKEV